MVSNIQPALNKNLSFLPLDFFQNVQQEIEQNRHTEAITNLLFLFLDVPEIPDIKRAYAYLFRLFPHFSYEQWIRLRKSLPSLLQQSASLHEEQRQLTLKLADWCLDYAKTVPNPFPFYLEAMDYLSRGLQIAQQKDPFSCLLHHQAASKVFVHWIKSQLLGNNRMQNQLDTALRKGDVKGFEELLRTIEDLTRFCVEEDDIHLIRGLYRQARDLLIKMNDASLEQFKQYIPQVNQGLSRLLNPQDCLATQKYQKKLEIFRAYFKSLNHSTKLSNDFSQWRGFQASITQHFLSFIQSLLTDAFALLGPPPCGYDLRAMGSIAREEVCPFSDLEPFILVEKEDAEIKQYFTLLLQLLDLQIRSLGETAAASLIFSCIHTKNPSGLHLDYGENLADLIKTPTTLAGLQKVDHPDHQDASAEDPSTLAHTALKSYSLSCNNPSLIQEYLKALNSLGNKSRQEKALKYLKKRWNDFKEKKLTGFLSTSVHLKKEFVEPLNYVLADIALYFGLEATNTLDIIEALAKEQILTQESAALIKKAVMVIYEIRLRLHTHYGEQREEGVCSPIDLQTYVFSQQEQDQLRRISGLILRPFYSCIASIFQGNQSADLIFHHIDLIQIVLKELFSGQDPSFLKPFIPSLVAYLVEIKTPLEKHKEYFRRLSDRDFEPLRQAYLEALKLSQQDEIVKLLSDIPNRSGFRYSSLFHLNNLYSYLKNLTLDNPSSNPVQVRIKEASFGCRYLKPDLIASLLDEKGDIRRSYLGSAHNVTGLGGLHFKQKPIHPLMEFAIHHLFYRLGGFLTPSSLLVRFEVTVKGQTKVYPVLISETIPGKTLKELETLKQPLQMSPAAWAQWTWLILGSLLTRPGDGLLSNYLVNEQGQVFCIDNDISFVEPVVQEGVLKRRVIYFCSALFCFFHDKPLDPQVLETFCSLDPDLILNAWIEDVIEQEKVYLSLFTPEEQEKLYTEDRNNQFKATILFKQGTLATLTLQFCRLQNYLLSALGQKKPVTSLDLLRQLLSLKDSPTLEISAGTRVAERYQKAIEAERSVEKQLQNVTSRNTTQSMTSKQSDIACLGKPPTLEEIQKKQSYSPAKAREELFSTLLKRTREDISEGIVEGKRVLGVSFKKVQSEGAPDLSRQDLILDALVFMLNQAPQKYVSLTLQHCAVLDGAKLDPFLHPQLEVLDLRFCPLITEKVVQTIAQKCPHLQELYLSGTTVRWIAQTGIMTNGPLDLPLLTHLQVEKTSSLQEIRLRAPRLKKLIANDNLSLHTVENFNLEIFPHFEFTNCQNLGLEKLFMKLTPFRIFNQLLTKLRKDPYIFPYPLPFLLLEALGEALSREILTLGYEEADKRYIEPLFELIVLSKVDPSMETTAANAITILNFAHISFAGRDLRGVRIPGANLGRACLKKADLRGADLKGARLSEAELDHCQLTGANLQHVEMRPEIIWCKGPVNCLIADRTGKRWIAALGNSISIVDIETGIEVKKLTGHTSEVTALALLEGGKQLASGSRDQTIRVWEVETGREVKTLTGHTGPVMTLAVLEGDKKLASGSADETIRVWEVETGREVKKLTGHTGPVMTLAVLEGGKKLASGSWDLTIRVWEVETGREVKTLTGHTSWVTALAVLEGGKKLASGSGDQTIRVWEVETGRGLFANSTISKIDSLTYKEPDLLFAGDESGEVWCGRLDFKTPEQPYTLLWTHRPTLSCQGVDISHVLNLSEMNTAIMQANGAIKQSPAIPEPQANQPLAVRRGDILHSARK